MTIAKHREAQKMNEAYLMPPRNLDEIRERIRLEDTKRKAYWQRPRVKAHRKAYLKAYRQRPRVKAHRKAYMKAYMKAYLKAYLQRPRVKAHRKAYMKAYMKAYYQRRRRRFSKQVQIAVLQHPEIFKQSEMKK